MKLLGDVNARRRGVHRPDIDGLRALAVLPVIAYHAGIGLVPGGFIGVDVFFVISGYLITQVLLKDIDADGFSLVNFYERRVRRIAPALLGVLIGTFIVCAIYSLPSEFVDYSKSLIAAALSASNFYFLRTSNYFSAPALTKPLLHTWSLAVEEQFYIFWPLCLLAGRRFFKNHLLLVATLATCTSLAVSTAGVFLAPAATFYLVPTRAWELFLGALLALGMFSQPLHALARNLLALFGVALIVGSALLIRGYMPFPGALAGPACIGAFLVILAGRDGTSIVGRILAWRPVAFVGLISYSLYLWHWPLIVFQRDYGLLLIPGTPDRDQKLMVIACSLILGALSWKFIEQPFRVGSRKPRREKLFLITATTASVLIACGAAAWVDSGFPSRYSPQQLRVASYLTYRDTSTANRCFLDGSGDLAAFPSSCLRLSAGQRNFLILGDSHAWELAYGLNREYPGIHFLEASASDCFPVLYHGWKEAPFCVHAVNTVLRGFLTTHHVDRVIIAARWKASYLPEISETLSWLRRRNIPVTLVGPTLVFDLPLPRLMLTAQRMSEPDLINKNWDHSLRELDARMAVVARENGAQYISMIQMFCPRQCILTDATGMPLVFDQEHLTEAGSIVVAKELRERGWWSLPPANQHETSARRGTAQGGV